MQNAQCKHLHDRFYKLDTTNLNITEEKYDYNNSVYADPKVSLSAIGLTNNPKVASGAAELNDRLNDQLMIM